MGDSQDDLVSAELRSIESEIDGYYKRNHLVELPFATAAWHLMVAWEDAMDPAHVGRVVISPWSSSSARTDQLVFSMQYPFRWLWESCEPGGRIPQVCDRRAYEAGHQLLRLGDAYTAFAAAFTHASRGTVELELQGSRISATRPAGYDTRYEAYDLRERTPEPAERVRLDLLIEEVAKSFRERGDAFTYDLSPGSVRLAAEIIAPLVSRKFTLPDDWEFEGYSVSDFREAWTRLEAIAYLHNAARLIAVSRGIGGKMHAGSVIAATREELVKRVGRYSGVDETALGCLLEDLTYGGRAIRQPDPAIQPLIKLNNEQYGIMPWLLMASSSERNLTVLLNRLPAQRKRYLKLASSKEEFMRERIKESLQSLGIRFFQGNIPGEDGLPDIDLAVIGDSERVCLILELKWFINPAEVRELDEKAEEVRKGISQLVLLRRAIAQHDTSARRVLGIDSTYKVSFAVVSANSIGHHTVQHSEVPVVRESHLTSKLRSTKRLSDVSTWLSMRSFLPTEGADYRVVERTATIGQWSLDWYGIERLFDREPA